MTNEGSSPITVRIADPDDGPIIASIYAPIVEDTFISFEDRPPSADEMAQRVKATLATHPWLVAERDGQVLGYAYATSHRTRAAYRWSCDVSVYIAEDGRRQGVGRRLYSSLFQTLINQGLGTAFAGIALPNDASIGLHQRMGFEWVGTYKSVGFKQGSWRDVSWWSHPLQQLDNEPADPLPFGSNRDSFVP